MMSALPINVLDIWHIHTFMTIVYPYLIVVVGIPQDSLIPLQCLNYKVLLFLWCTIAALSQYLYIDCFLPRSFTCA